MSEFSSDDKRSSERYLNILRNSVAHNRLLYNSGLEKKTKVEDTLADILAHREEIKNRGIEQGIEHRKKTLTTLFYFLGIETFVIFLFTFLQAVNWLGFNLEEWSFKLLVTVTISQITIMLLVAVKYLFPEQK